MPYNYGMINLVHIKKRKRLFINRKTSSKDRKKIILRAAENYDTVVFPLGEKLSAETDYIKLARKLNLNIEAGGRELSLLLPRKKFLFHRDLFRMEHGKRKLRHFFCPTNPKTTAAIAEQAEKLFSASLQILSSPRVFLLLPDEGQEKMLCACPACRAFSAAEQNVIAVSAAADVLAKLDPSALIAFADIRTELEIEAASERGQTGIAPRINMFAI